MELLDCVNEKLGLWLTCCMLDSKRLNKLNEAQWTVKKSKAYNEGTVGISVYIPS